MALETFYVDRPYAWWWCPLQANPVRMETTRIQGSRPNWVIPADDRRAAIYLEWAKTSPIDWALVASTVCQAIENGQLAWALHGGLPDYCTVELPVDLTKGERDIVGAWLGEKGTPVEADIYPETTSTSRNTLQWGVLVGGRHRLWGAKNSYVSPLPIQSTSMHHVKYYLRAGSGNPRHVIKGLLEHRDEWQHRSHELNADKAVRELNQNHLAAIDLCLQRL